MKGGFMILLAIAMMACSTTPTEEAVDCSKMITCTLVSCDGSPFGTVQVPECDAELFERGCCEPIPEVTCNCPTD